jgi:hypothetical protein
MSNPKLTRENAVFAMTASKQLYVNLRDFVLQMFARLQNSRHLDNAIIFAASDAIYRRRARQKDRQIAQDYFGRLRSHLKGAPWLEEVRIALFRNH